jgi:hypothetical protein
MWRWILGGLGFSAVATLLAVLLPGRGRLREPPPAVLRPERAALAIVESEGGGVERVDADNNVRTAAAGARLAAGERLRTSPQNGQARLRLRDNVVLDCGPDTELRLPESAEVIQLRGDIRMTVAPRLGRAPLIVETPHGAIRVVGTRLRSLVGPAATCVETEEGRVEVTRAADGAKTEVGAGHYVILADTAEPLAARETPLLVTEPARVLRQETFQIPLSAVFASGGKTLISGDDAGVLRFWDLATGKVRRSVQAGDKSGMKNLALSPDGRLLATIDSSGRARFYKAETGEAAGGPAQRFGHGFGLVFCDGGALVAAEGNVAGPRAAIRLWKAGTAERAEDLLMDADHIRCLATAGEGRILACGDNRGDVTLWGVQARRPLRQWRAHERPVTAIDMSPDEMWLATGSADAAVKLWDAASGQLRATLKAHTDDVVALAFSPDRMLLASGDRRGTTRLWDVRMAREVAVFRWDRQFELRITFSPDGRALAIAGARQDVRLYTVPDELRQSSGVWPR